MNRLFLSGLTLTIVSLLGYIIGVYVTYPGRAFTITGIMVGLTLLGIGWRSE